MFVVDEMTGHAIASTPTAARGGLTAALTAATVMALSGTASAYSVDPSGRPGSVGVPVTQGWQPNQGDDLRPVVSFPRRCVGRSRRASASVQIVKVYLEVYENNRRYDRWEFLTQGVFSKRLAPGERVCIARYSVPVATIGDNAFSVQVVATWTRASTRRRLGKLTIDYDDLADYQCVTTFGCQIDVFNSSAGMLLGGFR
jgi:hypothetical protein